MKPKETRRKVDPPTIRKPRLFGHLFTQTITEMVARDGLDSALRNPDRSQMETCYLLTLSWSASNGEAVAAARRSAVSRLMKARNGKFLAGSIRGAPGDGESK
jgi:hypothetical protein